MFRHQIELVPQLPAQVNPEFQGSGQYLAEEGRNVLSKLPYFDAVFTDSVVKVRRSRRQKRQEKMAVTARRSSGLPETEICDTDNRYDFQQLQRQDESLQNIFKQAVEVQQVQTTDGSTGALGTVVKVGP